jgi:TonB-linked SusC/RagA family outer membrane protein
MINNYLKLKKWYVTGAVLMLFYTCSFAGVSVSRRGGEFPDPVDTIRGVVLDNNGKPLQNVYVKNEALHQRTTTLADGTFKLAGKVGDRIGFEHPEYYYLGVVWSGQPKLVVQLFHRFLPANTFSRINEKDSTLKEDAMVNVLHGTQPKSDVLQSVSTVNNSQLMTTPASQFLQALPGRIAGLNIAFTGGGPGLDGAGISYDIRKARGANIILIDGVQRAYTSIDPDQIESVSVLKDALATVMLGMRSSNGIISIITKKGITGAPRMSFSAQGGIETPTALPQPLDAAQYAILHNEAQLNDAPAGTIPTYSPADIAAYQNGTDPYNHPNVDWYKTVLNPHSYINRYNFNVQGSGSGFRYFVDVDNLKETGLIKTNDSLNTYNTNAELDRYIVRSNVGIDVTKTTTMQLNLFGRIERYNQPGGSTATLFNSLATTPRNAYPEFNPNGTLGGTSTLGQNANIYGQSVEEGYQFQDAKDMSVDLSLTQRLDAIIPGLYAKVQGSYNNSTTYNTVRSKNFASYQYNANGTYTTTGTISTQGTNGTPGIRGRVTYAEGELGYDKTFNKNHVTALAIADQQSTLQYDTGNLPEIYSNYGGRVTYSWDDKYLFEGAGSYAGYNWFAPAKRWAPYWAAGLGWNMHNEDFIKENFKWISNLKLRATYGLTGQVNSSSGYFSYIQSYWTPSSNTNNSDGYYFGTTGVGIVRSTGQSTLANPNLGAEKAHKMNLGFDLGMFNNKLMITAEYFYNHFFDLLGTPGITTAVLGIGYPLENLYRYNYYGSDISLNYQARINNFNFFVAGNFSVVQSKVVYMDEINHPYGYQYSTGKPVGLLQGYIATGLFQSYAEINDPKTAILASTPRSSLRPGDIRYLDRNGDGVIDSRDIGPIGSSKPFIYYGGTIGFNYKGLDMSALVQGILNRQTALGGPTSQYGDFYNGFGNGGAGNAYTFNLGRWTTATAATATQPRLFLGSNVDDQQVSTYWLKNTDFVRLKNVEVGYTLPSELTRKIGVPSLRLFANGLNLVTWSPLFSFRKDIDPESLGTGYPILKVVNLGITAKF